MDSIPLGIKHTLDYTAIGTAMGAFFGVLPKIAAVMSIVWLGWQMYDRIKYGPRRK